MEVKTKGRKPNFYLNIERDYAELFAVEIHPEGSIRGPIGEWCGLMDYFPTVESENKFKDTHVYAGYVLSVYRQSTPYDEYFKADVLPILEEAGTQTVLDLYPGVAVGAAICAKAGMQAYFREERGRLTWLAPYHIHANKVQVNEHAGEEVDAVLCSGCLNTTREPQAILDIANRFLKPGGLLVVTGVNFIMFDPWNPGDTQPDVDSMIRENGYAYLQAGIYRKIERITE